MAKALVFVAIGFILSQFFDKLVSFSGVGNDLVVQMDEKGFRPQNITINRGETIIFKNIGKEAHWPASNIHPTHEIHSEFDPKKPIASSESWSFRFEKEGEFRFHDHLNPRFTGNIITKEKKSTNSKSQSQNRSNIVWLDRISSIFNFTPTKNLKVNREFSKPIAIDSKKLYKEADFGCGNSDFSCIDNLLSDITKKYGPRSAIDILGFLQNDQKILRSIDDHQLTHRIGRQTAERFGISSKAFFLCSNQYNYGCQHGYFEHALEENNSVRETASLICESIEKSAPPKQRFYCYHGVGHGVMMAQAYDLLGSLAICDSLANSTAYEGCWQGVFMENANAYMRGEARKDIFSEDPLAPCNTVEEKYRHECFINHAGPLILFFKNDVKNATAACLNAPGGHISSCLQSIGLMVTNPAWQSTLAKDLLPQTDGIQTAWHICQQFPMGYIDQCVIGGVDNILNFDQLNIGRAIKFCNTNLGIHRPPCYKRIGISLSVQSSSKQIVSEKCASVPDEYREECIEGAGL